MLATYFYVLLLPRHRQGLYFYMPFATPRISDDPAFRLRRTESILDCAWTYVVPASVPTLLLPGCTYITDGKGPGTPA